MDDPSDKTSPNTAPDAALRAVRQQSAQGKRARVNPKTQKPAKLSRENQWIGFVVMAFGALAVIAVALLYVSQKKASAPAEQVYATVPQNNQATPAPPVNAAPQNNNQTAQNYSNTPRTAKPRSNDLLSSLQGIEQTPPAEKLRKPPKTLAPGAINGAWQIDLGEQTAVIELKEDSYRLLVEGQTEYSVRYFSSGALEVRDNGVLVLTPDLSDQPPRDGKSYRNIYTRPFAMQAALQEGYMIWTPPSGDVGFFMPRVHPFLRLAPDNLAVWERL